MNDNDKSKVLNQFGSNLRSLRKDLALSQEELADLSGLDRSYLGAVERGEHNIALINIVRVSQALNLQPFKLLEGLVLLKGDFNNGS